MLRDNPDVTRKLRAIWALHVTDGLREQDLLDLLGHENEYVRSWAVSLLVERKQASDDALRRFARLARQDSSPLVRLYLASALQRVPPAKRWDVVAGLAAHTEDASDHNQPLMVWYAAEPLAEVDTARALALSLESKLPRLFSFTVQRIAATPDAGRAARADRPAGTDRGSGAAERSARRHQSDREEEVTASSSRAWRRTPRSRSPRPGA